MRSNIRSAGVVLVSVICAMLLAFGASAPAIAADKAVMIGGIKVGTIPPLIMSAVQAGAYRNYDRTGVVWPAQAKPYTGPNDLTLGDSIAVGIPAMKTAVNQALASLQGNETVTIVGMSAGCLVVDELFRQYAKNGTWADPAKVTVVLMADSSRQANIKGAQYSKQYNYTYQPPVDTPYNLIVVTKEYDGTSDFPDKLNFLAIANANAGAILLHDTTFFTDLSTVPAENITVSVPNSLGGVTTHYLIPTATLPLVQMFPFLKPMEASLKVKIDRGYSRNDVPKAAVSTAAVAALASSAPAVSTPAVTTAAVADSVVATPVAPKVLSGKLRARLEARKAAAASDTGTPAATSASGATDLSGGNMATPSTTAGTATSAKKAWKPGDGTLKRVIGKLLGGKTPVGATTESAASSSTTEGTGTS
ncbi:PE-PPE domain-containing protein [Mycolicibacterium hodleri]|uniref:PE-PPE domain-containing protein n=1 Tax=Mycolicibacterium hodleri TaxID=49897 RepID=A0A502E3J5_9MYCO|nr:PE-PPE domain-containing protein [Mycolicibacterium hodleri]TPG32265.1 PE-PPE domain-containing protein [Mycolicibacterium hodleri]